MLPKRQKLSRNTFPHHKDRSASWVGKALHISSYRGGEASSPPRFAVVVAKNKSTGAVSRNVFKRLVMAAIRENMAQLEQLPCREYVIFPKEHLRTLVHNEIRNDITIFSGEKTRT